MKNPLKVQSRVDDPPSPIFKQAPFVLTHETQVLYTKTNPALQVSAIGAALQVEIKVLVEEHATQAPALSKKYP